MAHLRVGPEPLARNRRNLKNEYLGGINFLTMSEPLFFLPPLCTFWLFCHPAPTFSAPTHTATQSLLKRFRERTSPLTAEQVAPALLTSSIEINAPDRYQRTLLIYTAMYYELSLAKLIACWPGICLDQQDSLGDTALTRASARERPDIALLLLDQGANPNVQSLLGYTPLSSAAVQGHEALVVRLLAYEGLFVNISCQEGATAYELALAAGQGKIADLISKHPRFLGRAQGERSARQPE